MNNKSSISEILEKFFFIISKIINYLFDNRITSSLGYIYRRAYWKTKLKSVGRGLEIYSRIIIHNPESVMIGNNCSINEFVHIWGGCGVSIGNNVMIASHTSITSSTHSPYEEIMGDSVIKKPITIEDNVWIGTHAVILPGVTIQSGAVVAAGAVVTRDVPKNAIVAGVPAKIIKHINRQ